MEDFHATLYVLYHYQISPFQYDKAAESIRTLQAKMAELNKAELPERLKARTEAFTTQRARLSKSVDELAGLLDGKDRTAILAAIEMMHAQYENLEKVF